MPLKPVTDAAANAVPDRVCARLQSSVVAHGCNKRSPVEIRPSLALACPRIDSTEDSEGYGRFSVRLVAGDQLPQPQPALQPWRFCAVNTGRSSIDRGMDASCPQVRHRRRRSR